MNQNLNKPERVFGLQVRCRELDSFKIRNFLRKLCGNFLDFFRDFLEEFLGFFLDLFGGFFWEDSFGRIF